MKIGIDARLWNETGVGRYIRALVTNLGKYDKHNEYVLFLKSPEFDTVKMPNSKWQKIEANIRWHTLQEQLLMPRIYKLARIDLLHIPYFSVPVFTSVPFIVTIHDLTISHFATGKATTKPLPVYFLKHAGYRLVMALAIRRACRVICVSQFVKQQLLAEYHLPADRIVVTYEAGQLESKSDTFLLIPYQNYILYVGNAHPHKNLVSLIKAFQTLRQTNPTLELVLIGKIDYFYNKLQIWVQKMQFKGVYFIGEVANNQLPIWYKQAKAFVFPSLSEGFGIPGLEAMSVRCPVVVSDIAVFREIYKEAAVYFKPTDVRDLAHKIDEILKNQTLKQQLVLQGKKRVKYFSWIQMAQETLKTYEDCARLRSGK